MRFKRGGRFRRGGGVQERKWGSGEEVGFRRGGEVQERREAQERRWGSGEEAQICTSQSTSCLKYKSVVREKDLIFSKDVAHAAVIHLPPLCAAVSGLITATVV